MPRPSVDVVVPFAGTEAELRSVADRLERLEQASEDSRTLVDNRPTGAAEVAREDIAVVRAPEAQAPGFARNRGAARGSAEWVVFLDADMEPVPDLLERYFDPAPGEEIAVLAGAIRAPLVPENEETPARRYARLRRSFDQRATLGRGRWAFAQTGNCAIRRSALESVGGFDETVRWGEDADLSFRLAARGWKIDARPAAIATHAGPPDILGLLRQRAAHGAGVAWVHRTHPGSFPPRRWPGLLWWGTRRGVAGAAAALHGERDAALLGILDAATVWATELGRLLPNRAASRSHRYPG